MATVRNISGERLSVPLLGREVDPDEVVEVEDRLVTDQVWPDVTWAVERDQVPTVDVEE